MTQSLPATLPARAGDVGDGEGDGDSDGGNGDAGKSGAGSANTDGPLAWMGVNSNAGDDNANSDGGDDNGNDQADSDDNDAGKFGVLGAGCGNAIIDGNDTSGAGNISDADGDGDDGESNDDDDDNDDDGDDIVAGNVGVLYPHW